MASSREKLGKALFEAMTQPQSGKPAAKSPFAGTKTSSKGSTSKIKAPPPPKWMKKDDPLRKNPAIAALADMQYKAGDWRQPFYSDERAARSASKKTQREYDRAHAPYSKYLPGLSREDVRLLRKAYAEKTGGKELPPMALWRLSASMEDGLTGDWKSDMARFAKQTSKEHDKPNALEKGLKKVGVSAANLALDGLKTLSIPQAAMGNLILMSQGKETMPWRGYWDPEYEGGREFMRNMGWGDHKWWGLGGEIIFDPLNLVGAGVVRKAAEGGGKLAGAEKLFRSVYKDGAVTKVYQGLGKSEREMLARALGAPEAKKLVTIESQLRTARADLQKAVKTKKKRSDIKTRIAHLEEAKAKFLERTQGAFKASTPAQRGEAIKKWAEAQGMQVSKPVGRDAQRAMAEAFADASRSTSSQLMNKNYRGYAKRLLDEAHLPRNPYSFLRESTEQTRQLLESPFGRQAALTFGIGRAKATLPLWSLAPKTGTNAKRLNGWFRTSVPERVAHRMFTRVSEMGADAGRVLSNYANDLGLSKADRAMLQVVGALTAASKEAGNGLRASLRSAGIWSDELDTAYTYIAGKMQELARQDPKVIDAINRRYDKIKERLPSWSLSREEFLASRLANQAYWPQALDPKVVKKFKKEHQADLMTGFARPYDEYKPMIPGTVDAALERVHKNPFHGTTMDDFVRAMEEAGIDSATAQTLAETIQQKLGFAAFPQAIGQTDEIMKYEWDAFVVMNERMKSHYRHLADKEIQRLIDDAGFPPEVFKRETAKGPMRNSTAGYKLMRGTMYLKFWFTSVNPVHYVNNMVGDYWNRFLSANHPRELLTTAGFKGAHTRKMSLNDREALNRTYKISEGVEFTGEEIYALSRMAGLGRGYIGADIDIFMDLINNEGDNFAKKSAKFMSRINMTREEAQRLETWMKHLKAGEDPWTAGIKTTRVHFDYNELTDFERVILRNVLMFYTWLRKNTAYQFKVMANRPGLALAHQKVTENREQFPFEPGYFKDAGAFTAPFGLGNWRIAGNPMADAYNKFDVSLQGLGRTFLGPLHPVPKELIQQVANYDFFTGKPIDKYEDLPDYKRHFMADLLKYIPGMPSRIVRTDYEGNGMLNSRIAHILGGVQGPMGGVSQRFAYDASFKTAFLEALRQTTGLSKQEAQDFWEQQEFNRARQKYMDQKQLYRITGQP